MTMRADLAAVAVLLLALAGCANVPARKDLASPCAASEASYECQVERYHNVNAE
ncbi:MAG: hypothetical protein V4864_06010 [Pseudomonadota bacterium]